MLVVLLTVPLPRSNKSPLTCSPKATFPSYLALPASVLVLASWSAVAPLMLRGVRLAIALFRVVGCPDSVEAAPVGLSHLWLWRRTRWPRAECEDRHPTIDRRDQIGGCGARGPRVVLRKPLDRGEHSWTQTAGGLGMYGNTFRVSVATWQCTWCSSFLRSVSILD